MPAANAKAMAEFKTGRLQRELLINGTLSASVKVGDVVKMSGSAIIAVTGSDSANSALAIDAAKAAIQEGNYIVAQSDMSMGDGHAKVEYSNYAYSDVVASTATAKDVAVFKIVNLDDIIAKAEVI